jgi:hypothetical protein
MAESAYSFDQWVRVEPALYSVGGYIYVDGCCFMACREKYSSKAYSVA